MTENEIVALLSDDDDIRSIVAAWDDEPPPEPRRTGGIRAGLDRIVRRAREQGQTPSETISTFVRAASAVKRLEGQAGRRAQRLDQAVRAFRAALWLADRVDPSWRDVGAVLAKGSGMMELWASTLSKHLDGR